MRDRLTERQNQAYEFIRSYMRRHQMPPTLVEIGEGLGIKSTNGVSKLVRALEQKGYLEREPYVARGLKLTETDAPYGLDGGGVPSLPLISRTPSDDPDALRRRPRGFLSVDPHFLKGALDAEDTCLIARAGDDGMAREGIRRGDFVVVEEQRLRQLREGPLVAALVGDSLRVRRLELSGGRIHLFPSDETYASENYAPRDPGCHVIGRVLAVFRTL